MRMFGQWLKSPHTSLINFRAIVTFMLLWINRYLIYDSEFVSLCHLQHQGIGNWLGMKKANFNKDIMIGEFTPL
jgi:hypothetical protein